MIKYKINIYIIKLKIIFYFYFLIFNDVKYLNILYLNYRMIFNNFLDLIFVNEIDYRDVGGATCSSTNLLTTTRKVEVWLDEKPSVVSCSNGYSYFNSVYDISWFDGWTLQRAVVAIKVDRICIGDNYVYNLIYDIVWGTYNS